jgi:hypothetical protein
MGSPKVWVIDTFVQALSQLPQLISTAISLEARLASQRRLLAGTLLSS